MYNPGELEASELRPRGLCSTRCPTRQYLATCTGGHAPLTSSAMPSKMQTGAETLRAAHQRLHSISLLDPPSSDVSRCSSVGQSSQLATRARTRCDVSISDHSSAAASVRAVMVPLSILQSPHNVAALEFAKRVNSGHWLRHTLRSMKISHLSA